MTRLTETQSLILARAATRPGNLALPLPEGLRGGVAAKVVAALIAKGWSRRSRPISVAVSRFGAKLAMVMAPR